MLTLSKLHSESVAYYESTVDDTRGVEAYYSEDGRQPARAWVVSVVPEAVPLLERMYGVKMVRLWGAKMSRGGSITRRLPVV
ncbi:hypothetical protein [Corynebacterium anserum]|uniref:hypothetical protein n=1 Tax=Corynebacterium anserum TaxID=2684406 RepID=UPI00163B15F2|nr:hypothetical protein [Corynebacterium anserum]